MLFKPECYAQSELGGLRIGTVDIYARSNTSRGHNRRVIARVTSDGKQVLGCYIYTQTLDKFVALERHCIAQCDVGKFEIVTIFKEVRSEDGSWDDLYDCLFALYRVGVPGSSPFGIIGGNQCVVLNVYCGVTYCGQFAFGFNSNKIAFRNRINQTSWGEWIQV